MEAGKIGLEVHVKLARSCAEAMISYKALFAIEKIEEKGKSSNESSSHIIKAYLAKNEALSLQLRKGSMEWNQRKNRNRSKYNPVGISKK
ncbi:MAG: hypothetical protein MHMPM18_001981 [Marteilia pararefringens]